MILRQTGAAKQTDKRKTSAARKPRASGLSRERIVGETLRYLRAHPHEHLTMARAGAAVDATAMAIYRHFRDGADLAEALVAEVLIGLEDSLPKGGDWQTQVRGWMVEIYRRLVETPQCVEMLTTSNGLSLAWVRATELLRRSLASAGLKGEKLADAVFWVSMTVGGVARQTLLIPLDKQIEGTIAALERLEDGEFGKKSAMIADVPRLYTNALDIMIEHTLASIGVMAGR